MAKVKGVSPDEPIEVTEAGGRHAASPYRLDLLDAQAILRLGAIVAEGATKYGQDNWRLIDVESHINHALVHLFAFMAGDDQDDHLGHALCRLMFAVGVSHE